MPTENPLDPPHHLEHLRNEINRLTQQQENALRMAVYVGMTEKESAGYDRRHSDIKALVQQMRTLREKPEPRT